MKTITKIIIFAFCLLPFAFPVQSQDLPEQWFVNSDGYTPVWYQSDTLKPLSAYTNTWLVFNGVNQFIRSWDIPETEFINSDSFSVFIKMKFGLPKKAMYICGHWDGSNSGWLFDYNVNDGDIVRFKLDSNSLKIDTIAVIDSTKWYTYDIRYNKGTKTFTAYVDGVLNCTYTNISYVSENVATCLVIGHGIASVGESSPAIGNLSPSTHFFRGIIDYFAIHKWYNGVDSSVVYNFNEGDIQYDSASFTVGDRTYSGLTNHSSGVHAHNGWQMGGYDTNDATISLGYRKTPPAVYMIGTGAWFWQTANSTWLQTFTNGMCPYRDGFVITTAINRVNVLPNTYYHNGDTASDIAYWNGSTWSKLGSNGSLFPGGSITQAYPYGEDTLVVGGSFTNVLSANGDGVLRYYGTTWDTLGKGFKNAVYCFTTFNGKLLAGGAFDTSGTTVMRSSVAQWNYNGWGAVGTSDIGEVWALEVHNSELYAGTSQGLYKYNGSDWTLLSSLSGATIYCLQSYGNQLWYGGTNGTLGYWDGSAHQMGTLSGFANHIIEFAKYGNDLYIVGSTYRINYNGVNTVCDKITRWNGREYSAVFTNTNMRPEDIFIKDYGDSAVMYYTGDQYIVDGVTVNNICGFNLTKSRVDNTSPVISHTSLADTAEYTFPLTITCQAYKENGTQLSSLVMSWKIGINGSYTNVSMTDNLNRNWSGSMAPDTSTTVTGDTVYYSFTATDMLGHVTTSSQYTFKILANPLLYRNNIAVLWIADSNVTTSGGKVTAWQNMVDTLTARQSTDATRPTLVSNFVNGHSAILFADKLLSFTARTDSVYTIIIVCKATSFTAGSLNVMLGGTAGDIYSSSRALNTGFGIGDGSANRYPVYNPADTNWSVKVFQSLHLYNNGIEPTYTGTGIPGNLTLSGIGRRPPTSFGYIGYIAEIWIFNEVLSTTNIQLNTTYLKNKYAIY